MPSALAALPRQEATETPNKMVVISKVYRKSNKKFATNIRSYDGSNAAIRLCSSIVARMDVGSTQPLIALIAHIFTPSCHLRAYVVVLEGICLILAVLAFRFHLYVQGYFTHQVSKASSTKPRYPLPLSFEELNTI